jgi:hypothetical protein
MSSFTEVSGAIALIVRAQGATVPYGGIVDGRDDVASLNARLGRGATGLRLIDNCSFRLLQAEAVCDIGRDRLHKEGRPRIWWSEKRSDSAFNLGYAWHEFGREQNK